MWPFVCLCPCVSVSDINGWLSWCILRGAFPLTTPPPRPPARLPVITKTHDLVMQHTTANCKPGKVNGLTNCCNVVNYNYKLQLQLQIILITILCGNQKSSQITAERNYAYNSKVLDLNFSETSNVFLTPSLEHQLKKVGQAEYRVSQEEADISPNLGYERHQWMAQGLLINFCPLLFNVCTIVHGPFVPFLF